MGGDRNDKKHRSCAQWLGEIQGRCLSSDGGACITSQPADVDMLLCLVAGCYVLVTSSDLLPSLLFATFGTVGLSELT